MEPKIIAFTRIRLPWGWLSNMTRHQLLFEGKLWPSPEALFQAMRFPAESARREEIRAIENPFEAKLYAKAHREEMSVVLQTGEDLDNMRLVLREKIMQHPIELGRQTEELIASGDSLIIEDCTRRPHGSGLFWGAQCLDRAGQVWEGENWLGRLWMELRAELQGVGSDDVRKWPAIESLS